MLGLDTPVKVAIFILHLSIWSAVDLFIHGSQQKGAAAYNPTSVVLLTDVVKVAMAVTMYVVNDGSVKDMADAAVTNVVLFAKFFIPALLFCLTNNLMFLNLSVFNPGTYKLLGQFRIVMIGVLYQMVLGKRLNRNQWQALFIITIGCMCKEADKFSKDTMLTFKLNLWAYGSLLAQMLFSALGAVYTEALLKDAVHPEATINLQNAFMYLNSILINVGTLAVQGQLGEAASMENIRGVLTPGVFGCILTMSTGGLATSFFLKYLDSVRKAIACAIEVILSVFLSFLLFGVPVTSSCIIATLLISAGVALYSSPPRDTEPNQHIVCDAEPHQHNEIQMSSVLGKRSVSGTLEIASAKELASVL